MSILKREVLYSTRGDQVKFLDWAITTTSIGACAEPFTVNDHLLPGVDVPDFDPSDIMVKVDALQRIEDEDHAKRALFGNTGPIHGGNLHPRVLIFTGNERGSL